VKVHFTERAAEDLESIHSYLAARSPAGARNVQLAMQATFAQLADFPYSGRAQTRPRLRKLGVPRYPYNVYYTVDDVADEVIIVTVRHTARAPEFRDG
jgi:toxin ParE1/3/4